jgi:hypothetical protein
MALTSTTLTLRNWQKKRVNEIEPGDADARHNLLRVICQAAGIQPKHDSE